MSDNATEEESVASRLSASMHKRLPDKLGKPALALAYADLRVTASAAGPLHAVLPGFLMAKYPADALKFHRLPAAQVPEEVRARVPEMIDAPLVQIDWRGLGIVVGRRRVGLHCGADKYAGWAQFRATVEELFGELIGTSAVQNVTGLSVKYVNFFAQRNGSVGNAGMMDWDLRLGGESLDQGSSSLQIRVERLVGDVQTVMVVASPAFLHGSASHPGGILDIEGTVVWPAPLDKVTFKPQLSNVLEKVRGVVKQTIFDSLSQAAIDEMEPTYGN